MFKQEFSIGESALSNLYLCGMMGSGKSTVGKILSRRLGYRFSDLDLEIEKRCKQSISKIFKDHGEFQFRSTETIVLRSLSKKSKLVIALGGGALKSFENRKIIAQTGTLVYLKGYATTLQKNIQRDKKNIRPLLEGLSTSSQLKKIRELMRDRNRWYNKANYTLRIDYRTPGHIAQELESLWRSRR